MSTGAMEPTAGTAPETVPPTRWIEGTPSLHRITTDIARPMEARPAAAGGSASGSPAPRC
jgi:hypothetical protein